MSGASKQRQGLVNIKERLNMDGQAVRKVRQK